MSRSYYNIILVTVSSWFSRAIVILSQFASMKILLAELGVSDYAAYILATSIGSWVLLLDFGFGAALQNHISERRANNQSYNDLVTFVFCVASAAVFLFVLVCISLSGWLAPLILAKQDFVEPQILIDRFNMILILFGVVALGGISYKVFFAEHRGYYANIFPAIASVVGLIMVANFLPAFKGDRVAFSIFIYSLPNAVITAIVFLTLLKTRWEPLIPGLKICKNAAGFWVVSLMIAITLNLDYLIISKKLTSEDVVVYQLITKVYGLLYFMFSAVLSAVWPVFSELIAVKDFEKIKIIAFRYVLLAIFSCIVFSIIFCVFRSEIAAFFFSGRAIPSIEAPFILLVGLYYTVLLIISVYTTALQSANIFSVFVFWTPIQAFLSVTFQWYLADILGIYGIVLGLLVSYILIPLWLIPQRFYKIINNKRVVL